MTNTNPARIDLVILAKELQKLDDRLCVFHSGTSSGFYLVKSKQRITIDMPLEQLFAFCIYNFAIDI